LSPDILRGKPLCYTKRRKNSQNAVFGVELDSQIWKKLLTAEQGIHKLLASFIRQTYGGFTP
jgi:hypothetical protein